MNQAKNQAMKWWCASKAVGAVAVGAMAVAQAQQSGVVTKVSSDPRNFNGVYGRLGGFGPVPSGVPGVSLGPQPNRMNCIPESSIAGGNPYMEQVIQTPNRLTFLSEFNHVTRRIYLDRTMPATVTPSYSGYSVGHWEGDTLVVETRGLKSFRPMGAAMSSVDRVIERISKSRDGTQLDKHLTYEGRDRDGKLVSSTGSVSYQFRGDVHLFEFICEEGAGDFNGEEGN
jgi:hypothetical protein